MALMFPRLARNFAKNGYYPTDEGSLERVLQALAPANGMMRILDPCAGEGAALTEVAHALGRDRVHAYGVEYDSERADSMATLADTALQGDLMDTVISPRTMGLLWLNPPYGDLVADHAHNMQHEGKGRQRLEKLFYQRTVNTLQYGGVLVLIIPVYSLDKELTGWLANHFTNLRVFRAAVDDFKQVVILGRRVRRYEVEGNVEAKRYRSQLLRVGMAEETPDVLPEEWLFDPYAVPAAKGEMGHFYRISLEPEQLGDEITQLSGLWSDTGAVFGRTGLKPRPPVRRLSNWHLALSLAAGAITGVVKSPAGRCLVVKGNTHKDKVAKTEFTENEDGSTKETRVLTDRFVPVIQAWEMTPGSAQQGQLLTITSMPSANDGEVADDQEGKQPSDAQAEPDKAQQVAERSYGTRGFELGRVVMTRSVNDLVANGQIDAMALLKRHIACDWGEICEEDQKTNQRALLDGERLMSIYQVGDSLTIWIITEADRSVTTLLLPEDY